MSDLVSVIVPVYNIKDLLPHCLSSIVNQTYRNLEIILVDDGSDDGSEHLCDQFVEMESRARVIHKPHQGLWTARNVGQEAATGEYLFFPDGDDYFHRDLILHLYAAINWQGKKYPLSLCNTKRTNSIIDSTESPIVPSFRILSKAELIRGLVELDEDRFDAQWNKLYRKSQLLSPVNRSFPRIQDLDSNLRLYLKINNAVLVDSILYYYYQHSKQLIKQSHYWDIRYKCEILIFTDAFEQLSAETRDYEDVILTRLYKRMIVYKAFSYKKKIYKDAIELCKNSERKTLSSFLSCRHIPLLKRYLFVYLLRHSRITHFLLQISNNV